jgi:hypothetical protein
MRLYHIVEGNHFSFEHLFEGTKEEFIADKMGSKLIQAANADSSYKSRNPAAIDVVGELGKFDPTPNKAYLQWLARQYVAGRFRIEDIHHLKAGLELFNKFKGKLANKDINSYKTVKELYTIIEPFEQDAPSASNKQQKQEIKKAGTEQLINTPNFKVYHVITHEAACHYGAGTKWCTATRDDPSMFDSYSKDGKIYVIITKNPATGKDRKFQLHYESDQFMDEHDSPVDKAEIAYLSSFPQWKEFLEDLTEKHYGKPE